MLTCNVNDNSNKKIHSFDMYDPELITNLKFVKIFSVRISQLTGSMTMQHGRLDIAGNYSVHWPLVSHHIDHPCVVTAYCSVTGDGLSVMPDNISSE